MGALTQSPAQREPLRTQSFYNGFVSTALDSRRGLMPWAPHPSSDVYQVVNAGLWCCVRTAVELGPGSGEGGMASGRNGSAALSCPPWGGPVLSWPNGPLKRMG